ncbi:MAG: insulinase family protein [Bacilli bacterium]|nr:insulinase family protein [Bacilli bacterium]MDD4623949.1 insulinase family protein [Bacilli bacterium]
MNYKRIEIDKLVLHTINTDIFKTINISINFRREFKREEITIIRILFELMLYSTKKYDYKSLIEKKEDLYNLHMNYSFGPEPSLYRQDIINIKFLDPKYSDITMEKDGIEFIKEILFNPNFDNEEYLNEVKSIVESDLLSFYNNKKKFAKQELLNNMESGNILSYNFLGYLEDFNSINLSNIKSLYKDIIEKDQIDIVVVGNIDNNFYEKELKGLFINNNRYSKLYIPNYSKRNETKEIFIEDKSISQSKLEIGLKILNYDEKQESVLFTLYRLILGVGSSSKLFREVREKNSLAYYSNAKRETDSIFIIESGIDGNKYKQVLSIIKEQINNMKVITDEEFNASKKLYISLLKNTYYNPTDIINYIYPNELLNYPRDIENILNELNIIKKEDIELLSNRVFIDTVLLYGVNNEKN